MKYGIAAVAVACLLLQGCTAERNAHTIESFQDTGAAWQYDQIKAQLSRAVDDPYALPFQTALGTAAISTTSGSQLGVTRAIGNLDKSTSTTLTLGAMTTSVATTLTSAVVSAKGLQVMRDLYANAVVGDPIAKEDIDALSSKPPTFGWFYHTNGAKPADCPSCAPLGKFGKYALWARSQKDYSDFALAVVNAASLKVVEKTVSVKLPNGKVVKKTVRTTEPTDATQKQNDVILQLK